MEYRIFLRKNFILNRRSDDSHKGQNGKVCIIGGSEQYVGAPALAGIAALRCGADLSIIIAPERVAWAINCISPDLVTEKIRCRNFSLKNFNAVMSKIKQHRPDCILIGCGIGNSSDTFIRKVISAVGNLNIPLVIDADAIKAIRISDAKRAVFTPHAKELQILLENSGFHDITAVGDRGKMAGIIQGHLGDNAIISKGREDMIIFSDEIIINRTGNPGMAKGGTGDVLAGLAAGYIAQGYGMRDASCFAAYMNGLAGDILMKKKKGYTYLASELAEEIGRVSLRLKK